MEKNNYNIKHDIPPLSSDAIKKHQDFDQLLAQYQASKLPKPAVNTKVRRLWQLGLAAAAVMTGILLYSVFTNVPTTRTSSSEDFFAQKNYIEAPIPQAQAQFASYTIDATEGGNIQHRKRSKLIIPPRTFMDRSGNFAMGEVTIKYREFHDFVDFFLAGIPMEYDSAGVQYVLESAGMIEVYAEQDGQRLSITPDKAIDIELLSEINIKNPKTPPSYNIYYLDEENRNWVYETVDNIEILEPVESATALLQDESEASIHNDFTQKITHIEKRYQKEVAAIEASIPYPTKPTAPNKGNSNNVVFDIDFTNQSTQNDASTAHQALNKAQTAVRNLQKQYEGTLWEVLPNQPQFNDEAASVVWEDMQLHQIGNQDYEVTLLGGNRQLKVKVRPVLMGNDYSKAQADFQTQMAAYQQQMSERSAQLAERKKELQAAIDLAKQTANASYEERIALYKKNGRDAMATDEMLRHKILNRFQVRSFGIWNCDRPLPPYAYALNSKFQDQHQTKYKNNVGYIVNKTQNTVRRFYVEDYNTSIQFNQNADNLMWIVTDDNKLAVYRPKNFKQIKNNQSEHTFVMDLNPQEIHSEEDARKILQF